MMKSANSRFEDENEDDILARIQEESLRYYNEVELPRRAAEESEKKKKEKCDAQIDLNEPQAHCSKVLDTVSSQIEVEVTPVKDVFCKGNDQGADGFHLAAGQTYVYPTNYPIRKYQKSIIHSALFHNTLVSLPTGLGKTFIAAVVMYNYYRWFPQGKIVFMAPTRPLVAQQIRACHDIMAIPIDDTVEMTGTMNPHDRVQRWKSKRVFFLTPQVMANDLRNGACPAKLFKCVVIDEAHRATKEYAFCVVIKELEKAGAIFRVLALSATPGSSIKAVGDVVQNLRIAVLELRGEDSEDVARYTHAKLVEPVSLALPDHVTQFREQFLVVFEKYTSNLRSARMITCNVQNFSKFQLLKSCEKLRMRPPAGMSKQKVGVMISDFTVCMTLAHGLELLQTYGLRAFYQYFTGGCEDEDNRKAAFTRLNQDIEFHKLMSDLNKLITQPMEQTWSHPKHEYLVNILKEHFSQFEKEGNVTKVIIFCQFRVVVSEVYELLLKVHPLIKPVMFIGQGLGKDKSGLPQKKQIEVMKRFREGASNVLIATSVAEEGLDIGAVDLLVLMDTQRSPVRLVQRLGRTGRHRAGRCVVLLTAGKEVQKFNEAMATRKNFINNIQKSKYLAEVLYKDEPAMIPPHLMPKIQLVHINVPERITPGKAKKQSDIRVSLVAKLNHSEAVTVTESPFLSKKELSKVKEELGGTAINFDSMKFTDNEYLHHRVNESQMSSEELFANKFICHSAFVDWNRVVHDAYVVPHSIDSLALCDLLNRSEAMQLGLEPCQHVSSQLNSSSLFPNKNKGGKTKNKSIENAKPKKKGKDEARGMDIRECMAVAADKARLTQEKFLNKDPIQVLDLPEPSEEPITSHAKQILHKNDDELPEQCSLCNHKEDTIFKRVPVFDEHLPFPFCRNQLLDVENLVQNLTLEDINNMDISTIFKSDEGFTKKEMQESILNMKQVAYSNLAENLAIITVNGDKNCNDLLEKSKMSYSRYPTNNINMKECKLNNINSNGLTNSENSEKAESEQELFDLEDIFSDDDNFNLELNIKTSTPRKQLISTAKTSCIKSARDLTVDSTNKMIKCVNPFRVNGNATNLNTKAKPIFKIPQLKLNLPTLKSPIFLRQGSGNDSNTSSPESPILSGQITTSRLERKALFPDNHSSLCKNANLSSPQSPILSGRIEDTVSSPVSKRHILFTDKCIGENPDSPIPSGQITAASCVSKFQRKALFTDIHSVVDNNASISSPVYPILSGQVTTSTASKPEQKAGKAPFLSFSKSSITASPESPILSGQITNTGSLKRPDRRVLFSDNYSDKEYKGDSTMCKPLNIRSNERNVPCSEASENLITCSQLFNSEPPADNVKDISVSQLFDDSSNDANEHNISVNQLFDDEVDRDKMNESSMYTISQMMAKVVEMQKENEKTSKESTVNRFKNNSIQFGGSDDGDSIIANIDMDQLSAVGTIETRKTSGLLVNSYHSNNPSVINECDQHVNTINNATETVYKVNKSVCFSNCVLGLKNVPEAHDKLSGDSFSSLESTFSKSGLQNKSTVLGHRKKSESVRWLTCSKLKNKSKETEPTVGSTTVRAINLEEESETNSDASLFISPTEQKTKKESTKKDSRHARKKRKEKGFVELEADVSGAPQSSDEENTSGLDDLDDSFINDLTEMPLTSLERSVVDMRSHYLQSVKSPFHKAGGYKIPTMSDSVLAMDVFSQAVQSDHDSYLNDSFCCDATEIPIDNDSSTLEEAEKILNKKRKVRKRKRKLAHVNSGSSSESEQICSKKVKKRRRLISGSSSDSDSKFVHSVKSIVRRNPIVDSSPENALPTEGPTSSRKDRRYNLLTSEDSDSDRTP